MMEKETELKGEVMGRVEIWMGFADGERCFAVASLDDPRVRLGFKAELPEEDSGPEAGAKVKRVCELLGEAIFEVNRRAVGVPGVEPPAGPNPFLVDQDPFRQ